MSKDSSAKYDQNNKERLQNNSREKYRSVSEDEKEKFDNMDEDKIQIYLKLKSSGYLSMEKDTMKCGKIITD